MTTAGTPLEGPKGTPDEQTNAAFVDAVRRIEAACGKLIERDSAYVDARSLIVTVLMRSVGIVDFLAASTMDHPREMTDLLRSKIHKAFGVPGDWGRETPLGRALSDLYQCRT